MTNNALRAVGGGDYCFEHEWSVLEKGPCPKCPSADKSSQEMIDEFTASFRKAHGISGQMMSESNYQLLTECTENLRQIQKAWHDPMLVDCIRKILEVLKRIA